MTDVVAMLAERAAHAVRPGAAERREYYAGYYFRLRDSYDAAATDRWLGKRAARLAEWAHYRAHAWAYLANGEAWKAAAARARAQECKRLVETSKRSYR